MTGKEKCRLLRKIRNEVAVKNGLTPFEDNCAHTGECMGTCPKCEAEVRMLTKALENRRARRKRVALAGVGIGVCAALTGCTLEDAVEAVSTVKHLISAPRAEQTAELILTGEVACPEEIGELTGDVPAEIADIETGEVDWEARE